MTIESLLAPVSPENSCGENLEYEADFMTMEKSASGKTEQQFGDTIIPAEAPDWAAVERLATGLLRHTKDLRVMLLLTLAWTQLRGLQGYADGLQLVYLAIERYWHQLHPRLESDGEQDPMFRINALAAIGDGTPLAQAARSAFLIKGGGAELSLRDAQALLDGSKDEVPQFPGGLPRLRNELSNQQQANIQALLSAAETLAMLRHAIHLHLGESALPEMSQLQRTLDVIVQAIRAPENNGPREADPDVILTPEALNPLGDILPMAPVEFGFGQVQSRADALHLLEKIKDYFVRYEPSHPAPLMIERLQRLINFNFLQIVGDLAPDGLRQLEVILGVEEKKNGES
ncbi:type VI secretion system protein TssA [Enterobacillus tribolii]|uniref:Type VI secretion system protein ImpA n=1 Tax=Enterobacillus tribolii TaxID=1487935 RepID=A0A370QSA2_9GAMM|nr:type VI secretion system protein TssA [Enterobacillus tribolii]MBW7983731.1 type VI secretion system protein TssA [Enterobacillus tribolii]RDK92095.1 type VI secretion system protein ImpA [Enterobacillus tribolii]